MVVSRSRAQNLPALSTPHSVHSHSSETSKADRTVAELYTTTSRKRRRLSNLHADDSDDSDQNVAPVVSTTSRVRPPDKVSPPQKVLGIEQKIISNGKVVDTQSSFATLNVAPWLIASLSAMAIQRPTAVQKGCIPEILAGKDVIGGSRTGSGKTVAFSVPILQMWAEDPMAIFAVVLTPTR